MAAGTAIGVCTLVVWVLAAGCGGGAPAGSNAAATTKSPDKGPTEAVLHPLKGSGVSGKVVYVKQRTGMPLAKIRLEGLEKATGETQYFLWQLGSRHNMVSPASYHVPHGDRLSVNLEPSPEGLAWLEDGSTTEFLVTKIENDDAYFASRERASSASDPAMIGTPVARGAFSGPLVGESSE